VRHTGRLKDYHGERELVLAAADDFQVLEGELSPVEPLEVGAAEIGDGTEGRLVTVVGVVEDRRGTNLTLTDDSGSARVVLRPAAEIQAPQARPGGRLAVTGVVGQYARSAPWADGFRLTPRWASDLVGLSGSGPLRLPRTGRAAGSEQGPGADLSSGSTGARPRTAPARP
jgi:DNA/RNA endonuclease YhcR with UshA esterase domain